MGSWIDCTLADLGTVVGGATPSTKQEENYLNGTIPWITPKDLSTLSGRFISRGERNITQRGLDSCSAQLMPKHSVLFSSRAPIGYVAISKCELCTNQGFKSIVPNSRTDYMFLYYLLKYNKNAIENMGSGTTFKEVSGSTMKGIRVRVPADKEEQTRIAGILSAIDDKIEENERINCNLEQQARAIYQNMIIDNQSDEWETGKLSDIAEITMGQSPKGDTYNENSTGTVFYQGRAEFGSRFPTRRLFTTEPKRMANENDVLLSVRAPVGDLNVATEPCCIGRGLGAIHSIDNHQSFVLYTMFAVRKQLDIFNGEGTVFGSINKEALNTISVIIPDKPTLDRFETIVAPIDSAIRTNYEEICRLQSIRDTLLPKLMNGEIDVSEVEI